MARVRITTPSVVTPRTCAPLVVQPTLGLEGPGSRVVRVTVDAVHFATNPIDFENGVAGSTMRAALLLVGPDSYIYWLHTAPTPSGDAATGYDPGDFPATFPETEDRTGFACSLAAGFNTPEAHATLLAATLATVPGVLAA